MLVNADTGTVDHLYVAVVSLYDSVHKLIPDTLLAPAVETVVAGRVRPVAFRQVPPGGPGAEHPQDAVQYTPVVHSRYASGLVGQQRLDHAPLEVGQVVALHRKAPAIWELESRFALPDNYFMGTGPSDTVIIAAHQCFRTMFLPLNLARCRHEPALAKLCQIRLRWLDAAVVQIHVRNTANSASDALQNLLVLKVAGNNERNPLSR